MVSKYSVETWYYRTDPVLEAIAKKLHGIDGVPLAERERMIRRAAKAGAKALREQNAEITSGKKYLALVRFLAKYQDDLNDLREQCMGMTPEECKDALIMRWPVIQGTSNQIALKRIGDQEYDIKLVAKALREQNEEERDDLQVLG